MGSVLVVEDDPLVLRALGRLLCRMGHEPLLVESVAAALARLDEGPVDVILTDLHMRGQDGFALIRSLRSAGSTVPVVLVSGSESTEIQREADQSGVFALLQKPVDIAALAAVVTAALKAAPSTPDLPSP